MNKAAQSTENRRSDDHNSLPSRKETLLLEIGGLTTSHKGVVTMWKVVLSGTALN